MIEHLLSRRHFCGETSVASIGLSAAAPLIASAQKQSETASALSGVEWRNKQTEMAYRPLGKTGIMVSELVMGTFPFNDDSYIPVLEAGVECGINYIDTASAYSNGDVEKVIGNYLKMGNREKVHVATKLSFFYGFIDRKVNEIFKSQTKARQKELQKKVQSLLEKRRVATPGYYVDYFGGQMKQFDKTYLRHVVLAEFGYKKGWRESIKSQAHQLLDQSLTRLQTDYIDVLHCPHGVAMPEMMDGDIIKELFEEFKQSGKARFSAVSFHNDVTGNLSKVIEVGYYDAAMVAYNIANHAGLESVMFKAKEAGIGLIAMKVAKAVGMQNSPPWRLDKLNMIMPESGLSKYAKAYQWALQNPNLSCCASQMETVEIIKDNTSIVGKKVKLQPA